MQIPEPSPPCPVSRRQRVKSLQTNSLGKTARRNDKGVCELKRFPPIRLGRAMEGHGRSPSSLLEFLLA